MDDVLVIGAGISGLACAHALGARRRVRVLEAAPRAGGLVQGGTQDGFRWEEGPEAMPPGAAAVRALCSELALPIMEAPAAAARRYVLHEGALVEVPASPPALLASRLFSLRGKLRLLSEPLRARGVALHGSIADFVRHRLGQEFLERLVDPLVGGIHAGDAEELSFQACFPEAAELVARHGTVLAALRARVATREPGAPRALWKPRAGMQALVDALASALGARLELGRRVQGIVPLADGFRVDLADGSSSSAHAVVLATPLAAARALLAEVAPAAAQALTTMGAENLVSVVHAWRRADVVHALDGFGYLVPSRGGSPVLGTLFSSSLWPSAAPEGCVLLRTLLGGARHARLHALDDAELHEIALAEARTRLGARGKPLLVRLARYPAVIPRLDCGHALRLATLARELPPGLAVLGNFTRGIGLARLVSEARALAGRL